jgi:hypothetical protein
MQPGGEKINMNPFSDFSAAALSCDFDDRDNAMMI